MVAVASEINHHHITGQLEDNFADVGRAKLWIERSAA
jgi:hypothetical protein